jgi:hypothetical protein
MTGMGTLAVSVVLAASLAHAVVIVQGMVRPASVRFDFRFGDAHNLAGIVLQLVREHDNRESLRRLN